MTPSSRGGLGARKAGGRELLTLRIDEKNTRWNNIRHLRDNFSHVYVSCLLLLHLPCACRRASMVLVHQKFGYICLSPEKWGLLQN